MAIKLARLLAQCPSMSWVQFTSCVFETLTWASRSIQPKICYQVNDLGKQKQDAYFMTLPAMC